MTFMEAGEICRHVGISGTLRKSVAAQLTLMGYPEDTSHRSRVSASCKQLPCVWTLFGMALLTSYLLCCCIVPLEEFILCLFSPMLWHGGAETTNQLMDPSYQEPPKIRNPSGIVSWGCPVSLHGQSQQT